LNKPALRAGSRRRFLETALEYIRDHYQRPISNQQTGRRLKDVAFVPSSGNS